MSSNRLLCDLREGKALSFRQQLVMIIQLSIPAILSQISTVLMEYIDASMVGSLGADASASIGLVASTTWLVGNLCGSAAIGFTVQVSQYYGARREARARSVFRQGLVCVAALSVVLGMIGILIHRSLPVWLGGTPEILAGASSYFLIYSAAVPIAALLNLCCGALQCSGNMSVPGMILVLMCGMDVGYNYLCIFPSRRLHGFYVPGLGLGVTGAALGTLFAEATAAVICLIYILLRSELLISHYYREASARQNPSCAGDKTSSCENAQGVNQQSGAAPNFDGRTEPFFHLHDIQIAARIALPVALQSVVQNGAQIISTRIVSPLGTTAIAANSLSVTAESLCYMPGYGIGSAATTLIGQSVGAGRKDLVKRLGWLTTLFGMAIMAASGAFMYLCAPGMIVILTPDPAVWRLGAAVLRIEAFAEPMFGASIVANGVFRGAGDTLIPSCMSLVSMWAVRLPLAALLAPRIGLRGVWTAMAIELTFRGILYLAHLAGRRWTQKAVA